MTPAYTLCLRDIETEKTQMAQGTLAMFLLYSPVLPKVLPPELQRWWWKERKRENKQMKRIAES